MPISETISTNRADENKHGHYPHSGGRGGSFVYGESVYFEYKGKRIAVPAVEIDGSYFMEMPEVTTNNVFLLDVEGNLGPLSLNVRTSAQLKQIKANVIHNKTCRNVIGEIKRILER